MKNQKKGKIGGERRENICVVSSFPSSQLPNCNQIAIQTTGNTEPTYTHNKCEQRTKKSRKRVYRCPTKKAMSPIKNIPLSRMMEALIISPLGG